MYFKSFCFPNFSDLQDQSAKKTANKSPKEDDKKTRKPEVKRTPLKVKPPKPLDHKPWRGTDPKVEDIHRNNYLDNKDDLLVAR